MAWTITVDIGTTAMKIGLFTEQFVCLGMIHSEYELEHPRAGWMELSAEVYIDKMNSGILELMTSFPLAKNCVGAICLTSQGETLIFADHKNEPLYPAIIWLDGRADVEAAEISSVISNQLFYRKTGMPENNPSMPASKVRWFADHYPDLFERTQKIFLLVDWLAFYLCGRVVTDEAIQTSTGWFDINTRTLWMEMLEEISLHTSQIPEILPCGSQAGALLSHVADAFGLRNDVQVVLCGMDQVSSAIGGGNFKPGIVCETTGTALVLSATTTRPDYERPEQISFLAHVNHNYLMLPYCPTAGMLLKWFRREFADKEEQESLKSGVSVYQLMDSLAETGSGYEKGLFLLPDFEGRLTPKPNSNARGVLFGLTLETKRADIVRAILEAISFMLRENIEMIEAYGITVDAIRSLGGGANSKLLGEIKADILQKQIFPQSFVESTSLGAAMLGQVALGTYPDLDSAFSVVTATMGTSEKYFLPNNDKSEAVNIAYAQYQRIYHGLLESFMHSL